MDEVRGTVATNAGMFLLWNPEQVARVVDYDSWESELLEDEDIGRHVAAGSAIPINIGADGAFEMVVRVGSGETPASLTEREARYLTISSDAYLFSSDGVARLTGIEDVGIGSPNAGLRASVPAGRWSVAVNLIAWDEEPGARDSSGNPGHGALPDFVLLLTPARTGKYAYRQELATFPEPG